MEQKPVAGHEALAQPDADIAQRFLDEADAVAQRRERTIDRRALAWLQIANTGILAVYLLVFATQLRADGGLAQVLVFAFLVWGQLSSGMAQRWGMQRRLTRAHWPLILGGGVLLAAVLVLMFAAVFVPSFPVLPLYASVGLLALGFGGYAAAGLIRARRDPRPPVAPSAPLDRAARWGTILVGVTFGALTALAAAPEDVLRTVLLLLVVLGVAVWLFASDTEIGLSEIGAVWRWPHVVAVAVAGVALVGVVMLDLGARGLSSVGVSLGAVVLVLFVAVSFAQGHPRRG
ncbi:hypothetical protein [Microbacterium sp. NPDC089696]|uniref:hypothetical protein n=1 Tax=Microbacterium sp. NPDC089696 TaxID=3364199 RepID=UPI0038307C32